MRHWLMFATAISGALVAAVALTPGRAWAQGTDEFGAYGGLEERTAYESPQKYALEIRFGRYVPDVDSEFEGEGPYEQVFGKKARYQVGLEYDWQLLRIPYVGSFGPGVGLGYTSSKATALLNGTETRSGQRTTLQILPMYVVGVLRGDFIAHETPIPLAAYLKVGLGYAFWQSSGESKVERAEDGTVGRGAEYGYHLALGGMLLLNTLDRRGAADMDNATGVNHAYVFLEWTRNDLNSFGNGMQVGTSTWTTGLTLEF